MASASGRINTIKAERDYDRARNAYARQKRDAAQSAIDERFDRMESDATSEYRRQYRILREQLDSSYGDKEKQLQITSNIKDLDKSYKSQMDGISSARKQAKKETDDLDQYAKDFTSADYDAYAEEQTDKAMKRQDAVKGTGDRITGAVNDYFTGKYGKKDKEEITGYGVSTNPPMQEDPFGLYGEKKPFEGGLMDPSLSRNKALGEFTEEQQAERDKAEKDKKDKEDKEQADWVAKNGGEAFDRSRMTMSEDENGNPQWGARKETGDLTYHPALEAIKSMRPNDEEDDEDRRNYADIWGLGKYFSKRLHADDKDPMNRSGHLRRQAEMHDIEAGDHQKAMQSNLQVANRDYRGEAEKNAASQAAAENAQKVHNLGNAGAGAAALERDVKSADYNTHMQRSDTQRAEGIKNMEKMHDDRQVAEEERSGADVYDYTARDMNDYNARSGMLSMGGWQSDRRDRRPAEPPRDESPEVIPEETETPETPEPESTYIDKVSHQDLLNCAFQMYKDNPEFASKYPELARQAPDDWVATSRKDPGSSGLEHTLFKQPELDTPEYIQAVEEQAQKLWNGEPVMVGGKTFGGNGVKGPDALYQLWKGRGGEKGWEEAHDEQKWGNATSAEGRVQE